MSTSMQRRSYIITLTTQDPKQKTAMRNALWRLGAKERLPGVYTASLTAAEYAQLSRRFGVRARAQRP